MELTKKNPFKIFSNRSWIDQERPIVGNPVIIILIAFDSFFFSILKIISFITKNYFASINIHVYHEYNSRFIQFREISWILKKLEMKKKEKLKK